MRFILHLTDNGGWIVGSTPRVPEEKIYFYKGLSADGAVLTTEVQTEAQEFPTFEEAEQVLNDWRLRILGLKQ